MFFVSGDVNSISKSAVRAMVFTAEDKHLIKRLWVKCMEQNSIHGVPSFYKLIFHAFPITKKLRKSITYRHRTVGDRKSAAACWKSLPVVGDCRQFNAYSVVGFTLWLISLICANSHKSFMTLQSFSMTFQAWKMTFHAWKMTFRDRSTHCPYAFDRRLSLNVL